MKLLLAILLFLACGACGTAVVVASPSKTVTQYESCEYWWSKADDTLPRAKEPDPDLSDERVVMAGIECLLKMKGNKHPARFRGAISLEVSQIFENTTADVAALYYISYVFQQKWDHADAVALRGPDGNSNTRMIIAAAYKSYEKWFAKVKQLGLTKAREQKLDPLKDTQIHWY